MPRVTGSSTLPSFLLTNASSQCFNSAPTSKLMTSKVDDIANCQLESVLKSSMGGNLWAHLWVGELNQKDSLQRAEDCILWTAQRDRHLSASVHLPFLTTDRVHICLTVLLPCLPGSDSCTLKLWAKLFLPQVAFVGYLITRTRKVTNTAEPNLSLWIRVTNTSPKILRYLFHLFVVKYQRTFMIGDCQLARVGSKSYRKWEVPRIYNNFFPNFGLLLLLYTS